MKLKYLFLCLPLLFLVTSCHKPCTQAQVADLRLTANDLKINPYSGEEILIYKTLNEDSVYFPSGVRKTESHVSYTYDSESAKLDHDGCQGNYFQAQDNWMIKNDSLSDSRLDITLGFRYTLREPKTDKGFGLYFWIMGPQLLCFWGSYNFQEGALLNYTTASTNPSYRDSIVSYNPVISIGPKEFYNVYELYCQNPDDRDTAWISIAYYNLTDGLVGFKTTYGKTWYLDKIK
jgi:hypothetical protein